MASLCSEAAMGPIRNISIDEIEHISSDKVSRYYCDWLGSITCLRCDQSDMKILCKVLKWCVPVYRSMTLSCMKSGTSFMGVEDSSRFNKENTKT